MVISVVVQSFDLLSADVELNPEPKRLSTSIISICHWNLNSISAHNYTNCFF